MTEWLLPLAVTAASLSMTYFFCLRPMRRGHCGTGRQLQRPTTRPDRLDHELNQARIDLDSLRTGSSASTPSRPSQGRR